MLAPLHALIGLESAADKVVGALRESARIARAPVVGAFHITCSDETEQEVAGVFQKLFSQQTLPALKDLNRAAFRCANLGARYEWGAVRVAEDHYATQPARDDFKLMVLKINAHVGFCETPEGRRYGSIHRYDCDSTCCGALAGMLGGADLPAINELRTLFSRDGIDRIATLTSPDRVPDVQKALLAAVVNARLQSDEAVRDILEYEPASPTQFLVLPCVSINQPGPDTELVVGCHLIDRRAESPVPEYVGLGSDPAAYRVTHPSGQISLSDSGWQARP